VAMLTIVENNSQTYASEKYVLKGTTFKVQQTPVNGRKPGFAVRFLIY